MLVDVKKQTLAELRDPEKFSTVDWHIVFCRGVPHWWDDFQEPGFHHCYAMRYDGLAWVGVNHTASYTDVKIIPGTLSQGRKNIMKSPDTTAIIHVTAERPIGRMRALSVVAPFTCVETIKALLGIRAPMVLTPFQLYNYLYRRRDNGFTFRAK